MNTNYSVYIHVRPDINEIFYVGKGLPKRIRQSSNRNKYWKNIVNKNKGFVSHVVAGNLTEAEALKFEILLIEKLRNSGVKLCNMTDGGDGVSGYRHNETIKNKMSQSRTGKPSPLRGKKLSLETRKKLSIAHTGKKQSPEHIAKCANSRKGKKYSEEHRKAISNSLRGKKLPEKTVEKMRKPVVCITTNTTYKSVTEAAIELNLSSSNISRCCKGVFKQTGGYEFKYLTS